MSVVAVSLKKKSDWRGGVEANKIEERLKADTGRTIKAVCVVFFFKQKTAYEMSIGDWSSDVCSSDLLRPGGFLLVHTAPNLLFMKYGWPATRPVVRFVGHRAIAGKVDAWFEIARDYHVNEQSVGTLRRHLVAAGFPRPQVWVDPDVLRGGQFHLLNGFDGAPVRLARRVAALRPVRAFLGNDVLAIARRDER